jgi:hypothetical protein
MKNTNDTNGNRTSDLHLVTCAPSLHRTAVNIFVTSTVKCVWDFTSTSTRYRGADKSLPRPGRKQANVSVRMAWISLSALPCSEKKTWWQLASRCCWNSIRPWHASELVSFMVGLRTYQHLGIKHHTLTPRWDKFTVACDKGWEWVEQHVHSPHKL